MKKILATILALVAIATTAQAQSEITSGNVVVTEPKAGEHPDFTATSEEPDKYTAYVYVWINVETDAEMSAADVFEEGKNYRVIVKFDAVEPYTLSYDNTFTINGKSTWWSINGLYRVCDFAATTGISSITADDNANANANARWYTLDGKKLSGEPTKKGIYIYKGKKVVK